MARSSESNGGDTVIPTPDSSPEAAARNERLSRLLECSSDGILEVDADGRCTYSNGTGARLLGFEPSELVGTVLHEAIHPGGGFLTSAECAICQAVRNAQGLKIGEPGRRTHGVLSHKDGRAIPVSYTAVQIEVEGHPHGAVMSFYDDAEHRRLAAEVRDRTAELEESELRKTEFIATLAHELRNPLAPLRAALQVMRKASDDAISMDQLRAMMERQLQQLVRLVNDLLDIARVGSGQIVLQKERVALQEIMTAAVESSAPLREAAKNSVALDIPLEPLYLDADAARLTQVFTNLLNNAAQYGAAGAPIMVRVERDDSAVTIDIADSGVGIAREALNRIFDMFTRVGRDSKKAHAGLGVGLNLARRLVELHGGQLTASSEGLGKGSHFLTKLPLPDPAHGETSLGDMRATAGAVARASIRALIVDDNVDAAVALSLLLQLGGHATALAHDGPAALQMAGEFKPDIVLLDLGLPGMDGYEVARAIRRMPELGNPLLAALTGWGGPEDRLRTKQAGFDEHLTKPVDISVVEFLLTTLPKRGFHGGGKSPPVANGDTLDAPH